MTKDIEGAVIEKAVEELERKLEKISGEALNVKKAINQLLILNGQTARYLDTDAGITTGKMNIAPDQFFGKGLAPAVREFLKMKGRAASLNEIYDALIVGGFEFSGSPKFHKRNLAISLNKNTLVFVHIEASDSYGLREFYPDLPKEKKARRGKQKAKQEDLKPEEAEEQKTETPERKDEEENK